ncbi:unnamed protein product [Acanthoscelides obtectus]|uniref:DUF4371 domain-containing protein n=1 Tax=Acanthoscelides obtectus TaxID=200917 RepID=A0A9P0LSS7_ACAOB|nr:unnamed protein product [Acanthoscelides obtectus]CAK1635989.1 Zinc finger MYM-type protein 1 [Acanthoscelides obtectus]
MKTHEKSKVHMNNVFSFSILGTQLNSAYRNDLIKHNNQVDKNRYVLNKIINCIRFCGAFELALRGHDEKENSENRGIFKELVNFSAELDNELKVDIQSAKLFKGTSKTTQNELLECMLDVYYEEVKKKIANSPFVAVIADETTDVACEFHLVIIFRYLCKGQPVERFWRFYVPDGYDAKSIAACVLNVVNPLLDQNPNKLIAQSYDGASVMSDKNRIKTELQVLYQREELSTTSGAVPLSILLNEEGLNCTFQETLKPECAVKSGGGVGVFTLDQTGDFLPTDEADEASCSFPAIVDKGVSSSESLYEHINTLLLIFPKTSEEWQEIAYNIETRWNFPNCGGSIDGKHLRIVKPANSGSYFFNYKDYHSIVLMALVNADYEFIYVNVQYKVI